MMRSRVVRNLRTMFLMSALGLSACKGEKPRPSGTAPSASALASTLKPSAPAIIPKIGKATIIKEGGISATINKIAYQEYLSPNGARFNKGEFTRSRNELLVVELNISEAPKGTKYLGLEGDVECPARAWPAPGFFRFEDCRGLYNYNWELKVREKAVKVKLVAQQDTGKEGEATMILGTNELSFPTAKVGTVLGNYKELGEMGKIRALLGRISYDYRLACDSESGNYIKTKSGYNCNVGLDLSIGQPLPAGTTALTISGDMDCSIEEISRPGPATITFCCSYPSHLNLNTGRTTRPLRLAVDAYGSGKMRGRREFTIPVDYMKGVRWEGPPACVLDHSCYAYGEVPSKEEPILPPCKKETPKPQPVKKASPDSDRDHPEGIYTP